MTKNGSAKTPKGVVETLVEQSQPLKIHGAAAREIEKETERKKARDAIYSALSRWVGEVVELGDVIPVYRNGKRIGRLPQTLLGQGHEVDHIVAASKLLKTTELKNLQDEFQALSELSSSLSKGLINLDFMELVKLDAVAKKPSTETDVKVIRAIGTVTSTLIALSDIKEVIDTQIKEIASKLEKPHAQRGRPKNEATHGVALRLAKFYSRVTGKRPAYSEGPNGLSGDYTPALRSVFNALGWEKVSLKSPAEAAISQVTELDLQPYLNALSQGLMSYQPD